MGWIGNIFIVIGLWLAGNKNRFAFLFSVIGEVIWCVYAAWIEMYDLAFVCAVFAVIALRNFIKWNSENLKEKEC